MKKLGKLAAIAAATLLSSQAYAASFPDGFGGVGGFEPGSTRDPVTGAVTAPDSTTETESGKGNGKGGNGNDRNK